MIYTLPQINNRVAAINHHKSWFRNVLQKIWFYFLLWEWKDKYIDKYIYSQMFHPSSKCVFNCRVMGRVLEPFPVARGRGHCWTAPQFIAGPDLSIWGSSTLHKGTLAVLWRCPGTSLAIRTPFPLLSVNQELNQEPLASSPMQTRATTARCSMRTLSQNEHMGCWKATSSSCGSGETQTPSWSVEQINLSSTSF